LPLLLASRSACLFCLTLLLLRLCSARGKIGDQEAVDLCVEVASHLRYGCPHFLDDDDGGGGDGARSVASFTASSASGATAASARGPRGAPGGVGAGYPGSGPGLAREMAQALVNEAQVRWLATFPDRRSDDTTVIVALLCDWHRF